MKRRSNYRKKQKSGIYLFIFSFTFLFSFINVQFFNYSGVPLNSNPLLHEDIDISNDIQIYDNNTCKTQNLETLYKSYLLSCEITESKDLEYELLLFGTFSLGTIFILEFSVILKKRTKKCSEIKSEVKNHDNQGDLGYLIKEESLILNVVKDYLDNNRYFDKEKVFNYLSSRIAKNGLNLNNHGIRKVLNSLLDKNIIAEGSKLTKDDVLSNSNRNKIFEYIKENPGTYSNKIVRNLGLSTFLVNWHIDMLAIFDFIRVERIDSINAYFDSDMNSELDELFHVISRDKCSEIIDYLRENEKGTTKHRLSKELGMHPNTITKYINKINEFGLLHSIQLSSKVVYSLNTEKYLEILRN
jgi:predicted transcriptional regulator